VILSADWIDSKYEKVRGISVSIMRIDRSFVLLYACNGISILSFFRIFISYCNNITVSFLTFSFWELSNFVKCYSGTFTPCSISYCSRVLCYFKRDLSFAPRSAIISKRSLVIALLFPKAKNQTLPLIYSGIPSIHISRTRFVRLTLSQFGKISVVQTLII